MRKWGFTLLAVALSVSALTACAETSTTSSTAQGSQTASSGAASETPSRLDTILSRGTLICGVEGTIPGFSYVDSSGKYTGLDVDTCKAVAAALFGDPEKVEYRNLDSTARFPAVIGGEVDMLARNTTWTISRDAAGGNSLEFAPATFYDGQGVMVSTSSGITDLKGLEGKSVCVETGTTTELNLATRMTELGVKINEVKFQDSNATFAAYQEGRCEAITSDRSQLAAKRSALPTPDDHVLLETVMSKEPLGPVTINNDSRWFDVVKWVTYGLIQAEEFGITQANVEEKLQDKSPDVQRFLGSEGDLGQQLGLSNDFMVKANVGANSPLKIDRGLNKLWSEGGLMYSPPFR
jgi:general L-amino acid transport system substrate-binding protein